MNIINYTKISNEEWDYVINNSDLGWFWHKRDYIDFLFEINKTRKVKDLSFGIYDDDKLIAVCPMYIDKVNDIKKLGFYNEPTPFMAMKSGLSVSTKKKAYLTYFQHIENLAYKNQVTFIELRIPPLSNYCSKDSQVFNPLIKYSFTNIPVLTQIIDLKQSEDILWNNISKGHKANIKVANKIYKINYWDSSNLSKKTFYKYENLHEQAMGRKVRSNKSFEMFFNWVIKGDAILLEASLDEISIGYVYIIIYKKRAYYASGCRDNNKLYQSPSHLLIWESIKYLKKNNVEYLEMGTQHFGPSWHYNSTKKEINISNYKRSFGGFTKNVYVSEKFFNTPELKKMLIDRSKNFWRVNQHG